MIRYAGFTILTDPNFLHAGDHVHLGYGLSSKRKLNKAMRARSSGSSLLSIAHEATPSTLWVVSPLEGFMPRYSANSSQKPESATEMRDRSLEGKDVGFPANLPQLRKVTSLPGYLRVLIPDWNGSLWAAIYPVPSIRTSENIPYSIT